MARAKSVVSSLESVPEKYRELYVKVEADSPLAKLQPALVGQYALDVEAVSGVALEPVDSLKSALSAVRTERDEWKAKTMAYGELMPDDAKKLSTRVKELEAAKSIDATEQIEATKKQLAAKHAEELAQLRQTVSQRDSEVDSLVLDAAIESALGKAGAKSVSALVPFIRQSCRVVRDSKTHKPIGKVMQEDGKSPRVSKKQGSTNDMTIEEYVESLKGADEYSSFFNGSQASGTGAAAGAGARGAKGGAGAGLCGPA